MCKLRAMNNSNTGFIKRCTEPLSGWEKTTCNTFLFVWTKTICDVIKYKFVLGNVRRSRAIGVPFSFCRYVCARTKQQQKDVDNLWVVSFCSCGTCLSQKTTRLLKYMSQQLRSFDKMFKKKHKQLQSCVVTVRRTESAVNPCRSRLHALVSPKCSAWSHCSCYILI